MIVRWGTLFLGTLAAAAVLGSSAGARTGQFAPATTQVASSAQISSTQIKKILIAHGIDPAGVVVQRGVWNYAGPSCPGFGWTCTTATRVFQLSTRDSDNEFQCSPSNAPGGSATAPDSCTIVQNSTGGNNDARCFERSNSTGVTQSCVILQTNTTGDNHAQIQQQVDLHVGATQDATQYSGVNQQTSSGENDVHIQQNIHEETGDTAGGTQTQNGHQGVSIDQQNTTGDNHADVDQSGALNAEIDGNGPINQQQDTATSNPTTCVSFSGCPNANTGIQQDSSSGNNDAEVNQSNDLSARASKHATGSQTQGEPLGGLNSHMIEQMSSGLSNYHLSQHEHQDLDPQNPGPGLTQTQWGPMWGGSPQGTNPNDGFNVEQHSDQNAGNGAAESDQAFGNCDTTGHCTIHQHIDQNGNNQQNSCSGSDCHIALSCTTRGEGAGCTPVNGCDGPCGNQPSTPPPPASTLTPSTTTLSQSYSPYTGEPVTFTATVAPNGSTGTVTFTDGVTPICSNVPLTPSEGGPTASCDDANGLSTGTHVITATYSGDSTHSGSSGTLTDNVNEG